MYKSILLLAFLIPAGTSLAQDQPRPRVFMTVAEVSAARSGDAAMPGESILRTTLLQRAREALNTPMRYTVPGYPDQVLPEYRPWPVDRDSEMLLIRKDAADTDALAVAYAITGDTEFARRAWENVRVMLSTYEAFGSYHPHRENNDLAAAHAFMALATTWDLCADQGPGDVKELVLSEGVRRARFMYNTAVSDWKLNGLPVPFPTPGVPDEARPYNRNIFAMLTTNHCWVDVALLGCLALALEDEDVSSAGPGSTPDDWLRFAIHFFEYIAGIMPADGSYPESRVYGAPYAFEGAMPFFRALKKARGIDLFSSSRFFHNFAYGRLYAVWNHPGHGGIANFGEGWDHEWHSAAWIYAVAAAYRDPVLQWSANCWTRSGPATDETAWQYLACDPTLPEMRPDSAGLPRAIILFDMAHIHVRGGDPWGENDRLLSFRGMVAGRNQYEQHAAGRLPYIQTWHMHQSRNAVELIAGGSPLIWRDTDFTDGTRYYSVLTVNGGNQRQPEAALPGVTDFEATGQYVTFSSEIGAAYPELDSYVRRVVCIEPGIYVIIDRARAPKPVTMDLRLHFGSNAQTELTQPRGYLVVGSHEGALFSCALMSVDEFTEFADFSAELGKAATENASLTLRYGPRGTTTRLAAMAAIRADGSAEPARSVRQEVEGLLGAFYPDSIRPVAVVSVVDPDKVIYAVPATNAPARHLVTGLAGSEKYAFSSGCDGETVVIVLTKGATTAPQGLDSMTSAHGTLLFDVMSPECVITPVEVAPVESVQEITAGIAGSIAR